MVSKNSVDSVDSVTVIDPESGTILEGHDIKIKNGLISSIEPSPSKEDKKATNLYALPGLIDSHVHALSFLHEEVPGLFDLRWVFKQQKKNLSAYIRGGITTVRDLGSALKLIKKTSNKASQFKIISPRITYAGPIFTVPNGYPYFIDKISALITMITGPIKVEISESQGAPYARKMIDKCIAAGASVIKVAYQSVKYDENLTEIPIISLDLLRSMVEHAHKRNVPVAIHCCYRRDFQNLLSAPDIQFDSLEHLTIDEALSKDEIKQFADRRIPISTTLMTYGMIDHVERYEQLLNGEPERFEKKPFKFLQYAHEKLRSGQLADISNYVGESVLTTGSKYMRENLKNLHAVGVKIIMGSDSAGAVTPPGCPHWELLDMVRAGMKPLEALKSATCYGADIIGNPKIGRLQVGKIADIVLLEKNPLENIENVKTITAVIREGSLMFYKTQ